MTFSAMFISIELVQNYFDNQLAQHAQKQYLPIETHLQQLAALSDLSQENDNDLMSISQITSHAPLHANYSAAIDNQTLHISEVGNPKKIPFPIRSLQFQADNIALYVKQNHDFIRIYKSANSLSPYGPRIRSADSPSFLRQPYVNHSMHGQRFRSYFYEHSSIKNLYVHVMTPSSDIFHYRRITLLGITCAILFVNAVIIFIFFIILKRITQSLSQITQTAKQMSKGQHATPLKVHSNDEIGLLAQSFNNMLNNVQTKTAELIYERNRSKMILAQLPEGIIVTDLNNKLLSANRAAETMLGFSTDRAKGHEIISYLKNENLSSFFSNEFQLVKDNALVREVIIPNQNGKDDHYQITVSPLLDSTYQKTGMITVIRNITDEKQIRSLKDNFLRTVTHELRTPLTSIIGFLNILVKQDHGHLNDKQREFLDISILNAIYLKKLINDLLDLSSIHSGQLMLSQTSFDLNDTLDAVVNQQRKSIENKSNVISVDYQHPNMELYADKPKISQIFENLIINANKFTENGRIECILNQTAAFTTVIIKDSGQGLTENQKYQLFQAFDQQSTPPYIYDGISLELAIVKELVNLHHGQIFIESELDRGSIFTVNIPHASQLKKNSPIMAHSTNL
jgi:PAS domain S-box-containing protein